MTAYSYFREKLHKAAILRYIVRNAGAQMGEVIELSSASSSIGAVSGVFCVAALGLFALFQTGPSDDDDSNGGGGGGLMQPIS